MPHGCSVQCVMGEVFHGCSFQCVMGVAQSVSMVYCLVCDVYILVCVYGVLRSV